jgi:hypothetical protein
MGKIGIFPFGQPVQEVVQTDRSPKEVFVLGVYASAVHARWVNPDGRTVVKALAVASEPYIFWRGENASSIIREINIPTGLGYLEPARHDFNGPSGLALDSMILKPLQLTRNQVWLCDLVPHSCVNLSQQRAINRAYLTVSLDFNLPIPSVPGVPKILADEKRRNEILNEIWESGARKLVLLGDKPIQWFLAHFDQRWKKLADFGRDSSSYGIWHRTNLEGVEMEVLSLAHPRQIARLGRSSITWYDAHQEWLKRTSSNWTGIGSSH